MEESKECSWFSKDQRLETVTILWSAHYNLYNYTDDLAGREKISTNKDGSLTEVTVLVSSHAVDEPVVAARNTNDVNMRQTPISAIVDMKLGTSYAKLFTRESSKKSVNFRTLITPAGNETDLVVPLESIKSISEWSSYVRAMIELQVDVKLKDTCSDVAKNLKNPTQAYRGGPVGPMIGFKPVKQVYRPVSKKNNANTSGDHDSEDKVKPVDNEVECFLASKRVGIGKEISDNIQSICHNLDIKARGRKKK
nr:hypothetical protein [Tanacetum cinerariifolium]